MTEFFVGIHAIYKKIMVILLLIVFDTFRKIDIVITRHKLTVMSLCNHWIG